MLSHLLPAALGTVKDVAFHPTLGKNGAVFIETELVRITLSANETAQQFIRAGSRISYWRPADRCVVHNLDDDSVATHAVLRYVAKSDDCLRATRVARPDQCAAAVREMRSCQTLARVSAVLMVVSPLFSATVLAAPMPDVAMFAIVHSVFVGVSLYMRRRWEAVCAELFCEPMIGIELKRVS